ncbi:MAG TPA: purine-nucleoside phosphorylase, partial [Kandleria vitulina]|nr:purine-nucleoside phosphorylase [Kandleria vitulina]
MIGISRCLVGDNCTYRGDSNLVEELEELKKEGAILVCPEVLGGLPIPRD